MAPAEPAHRRRPLAAGRCRNGTAGPAVLALWLVSACGSTVPGVEGPPPPLAEVPAPDLTRLEPHVRRQIERVRDELGAALADEPRNDSTLAQRFGVQGQLYLAYSFEEAARVSFLNAQRLAPREFRWTYYLGRALGRAGDADASQRELERALVLEPEHVPTILALAELAFDLNQLDDAERLSREALAQHPESSAALFILGRLAARGDDAGQAIAYLEAARELDPGATELHYPLGLAYRAQGDLDAARRFLRQRGAVRVRIDDPLMDEVDALATGRQATQLAGDLAYLRGDVRGAAAAYRRALDADPDSVEVRLNLGAVLLTQRDLAGAETQFLEVTRVEPDNAQALFSLGVLRTRQNRDPEAVVYYEGALARDPLHTDAHFNLANAQLRLQRFDGAQAHFLHVVELDGLHATARYGRAVALIRARRWAEALRWLEVSHRQMPDAARITNALVRMLAACPVDGLRDGARALELAEGLVAVQRSVVDVEALAMALAEVGRFDDAIALQEQALTASRQAGRTEMEPTLTANLAHLRNARPIRTPLPSVPAG